MTAFGRAQKEESGYCVTVEIKTLNSRNLDVVLRLPKNHLDRDLEQVVRKQITQSIRRGRVEVYVQIEALSIDQRVPRFNLLLARYYWEQLQSLHRHLPGSDSPRLEHLFQCPNLFELGEDTTEPDILNGLITSALTEVLQKIHEMRAREGEVLLEDCLNRLTILRQELSSIGDRKDLVLDEYRQRLHNRIQDLLKGNDIELDENRLLQEIAFFADRSDITEEIVRVQSHLGQMEASLSGSDPAEGRKLDFLTQELHREVNTIGSKAGDLEITQAVVAMKSEIGKLKEQIQNVE
jgi:uncharacterized protein (TIGR00255 family)